MTFFLVYLVVSTVACGWLAYFAANAPELPWHD